MEVNKSDSDEEMDDFYPVLLPGSDHESDDDSIEAPSLHESDDSLDGDYELDPTFFANMTGNRKENGLNSWCMCSQCQEMPTETECVCCRESYNIQKIMAENHKCVTEVGLFKEIVLNKSGLLFCRYLRSLNIEDEEARKRYNDKKDDLPITKIRYLAYISFLNILSSQDTDRSIRYVLPSCVVTAVRLAFPNEPGVPYKGLIKLKSSDGQRLP